MDKDIDLVPHTITQDNQLIQAAYRLTTLEKRLLLVGMSRLNPMIQPVRGRAPIEELKITAGDWKRAFPDDKKPYQSLRRAADGMMNRQWRVNHGEGTYTKYNWLSRCSYDPNKGEIELMFTNDTALRLHGLTSEFTTLQLNQIGQLTSFNQIRLYELIYQFKATGFLSKSLEDLRDIMDLTDKHLTWSVFKRDALDPAIRSINKNTNLTVTYKTTKAIRKVIGIEFYFHEDKQTELSF